MISFKKCSKKDIPKLLEAKIETVEPYIKDKKKKLKAIMYINQDIKNNYDKGYIIKYWFREVGFYLIDQDRLELLYIKERDRNKKIGSRVLKRLDFKVIILREENKKGLEFYLRNGFKIKKKEDGVIYLERV